MGKIGIEPKMFTTRGTDLQSAVTPPIVTAFPEDTFSGLFGLNSSPQDKVKPVMEWEDLNLRRQEFVISALPAELHSI